MPLVITSLSSAVKYLVDAVHSYCGAVFHDVTNIRHAQKAVEAGIDGLILVCGAGGHAGTYSPFAFLSKVREMFDGTILLAGSISTGFDIAAARAIGADLAYMGTRFINTAESMASSGLSGHDCRATAKEVVYTPAISGVPANFLRNSIARVGLDPDNPPDKKDIDFGKELDTEVKAWETVWSAGHGVGAIHDANPPSVELIARLKREYEPTFPKWPTALRPDRLIWPIGKAFFASKFVDGRESARN